MAEERLQRRLAAILSADLMGLDGPERCPSLMPCGVS